MVDNPNKYDNHKAFIEKLDKCPYIDVVVGKLSKIATDPNVPIDIKNPKTFKHIEKNTDVNMASDMITSSADVIVMFSADADFESAVKRIRTNGKILLMVMPVGARGSHIIKTVSNENVVYLDEKFLNKYVVDREKSSDKVTKKYIWK